MMCDNRQLMSDLFDLLKNWFSENEISYISTPINTGERFIYWYNSIGKNLDNSSTSYRREFRKNVFEPNILHAKRYIKEIKESTNKIIIDPTNLENQTLNWTQDEFYAFWDSVIKELVKEVIFIDGWQYSIGCCYELFSAVKYNKDIYSQDMKKLCLQDAIYKMNKSMNAYKSINPNMNRKIGAIIDDLKVYHSKDNIINDLIDTSNFMKDKKLDLIISNSVGNIAQFVSFGPNSELIPRYVNINNFSHDKNMDPKDVIKKLILSAPSKCVNIRSYSPQVMKGNKLIFNKRLEDINEILDIIEQNSLDGKYSIINENLPIDDCGVSGVVLGTTIEFAPEDTPKCVDKEGICSLPRDLGLRILQTVYGFKPQLDFDENFRVEFSIHPSRQGVKNQHTIIWEYEYFDKIDGDKKIIWPNRFSKFLGDKVFGLLIADSLGILVPETTVISRKVAPFSFGTKTGSKEKWIRTCPIVKEPGKYFTGRKWTDPFILMNTEESKGEDEINIASILSQNAVEDIYSGASIITGDIGKDIIEGVSGSGDDFMIGKQGNDNLPKEVINSVYRLHDSVRMHLEKLGDVSIEWVYDGTQAWLVQLNQIKIDLKDVKANSRTIVKGNPLYYEKVDVKDGLDSLRDKIKLFVNTNIGIELIGDVGVTSHFGDLLRLANIPSIITRKNS